MKIKKIRIQNFRAFKDVVEFELNDFNCIIGKNDSGKSTILAALEWFFSDKELNEFDVNVDLPKDAFVYNPNALYVEIIFGDIISPENNNDYSFKSDKEFMNTIELCIRKNYKSDFIIKLYCKEMANDFEDCKRFSLIDDMFQYLYEYYRTNDYTRIVQSKFADFEFHSTVKQQIKIPIFRLFTPNCPLKEYLNILFKVKFLGADFDKNIADIKSKITSDINQKLLDSQRKDECYFNSITANIDYFPNEKDMMFYVDNSLLKNIPLENRGDGFQWEIKNIVCRLIAERISDRNDYHYIFAFEEPETHLHPKAQLEMYDSIKKLSKNNQVIITTHSPYIVKELAKDNINPIVVTREEESNESKINKLDRKKVLPYGSMNEINYIAFDLASEEFHQELYGQIEIDWFGESNGSKIDQIINKLQDYKCENRDKTFGEIVKTLIDNYNNANKSHIDLLSNEFVSPDKGKEPSRCFCHCVRNSIDHPCEGNVKWKEYGLIELSIKILLEINNCFKDIKKTFFGKIKDINNLDKLPDKFVDEEGEIKKDMYLREILNAVNLLNNYATQRPHNP